MALSVMLSDEPVAHAPAPPRGRRHAASRARVATSFTGDGPDPDAWMLFLHSEPEIGTRFRYADLLWEVVDYRDGWVARMVVGSHAHLPKIP